MFSNFLYLGKSVGYPVTVEAGSLKTITGISVINSALLMLLMTPVGTRYFLPEYGCKITELRWEPNDQILAKLIRTYVTDAISRWEKRIALYDVNILVREDACLCMIYYTVLNSNEIESFIYPFYRGNPDV